MGRTLKMTTPWIRTQTRVTLTRLEPGRYRAVVHIHVSRRTPTTMTVKPSTINFTTARCPDWRNGGESATSETLVTIKPRPANRNAHRRWRRRWRRLGSDAERGRLRVDREARHRISWTVANDTPTGAWSDGTTALDRRERRPGADDAIYAYDLDDGGPGRGA